MVRAAIFHLVFLAQCATVVAVRHSVVAVCCKVSFLCAVKNAAADTTLLLESAIRAIRVVRLAVDPLYHCALLVLRTSIWWEVSILRVARVVPHRSREL